MTELVIALRSLRRRPHATAAVVFTLGGAIAVVTVVFAICDSVLFAPLPYRNPGAIVHMAAPYHVFQRRPTEAQRIQRVAADSSLFTQRASARLTWVVQPGGEAALTWPLRAASVSPSLFDVLGILPALGRAFADADILAKPKPALLGHELWRDRFGSDPQVVGRVVEIPGTLDGEPWLIVGVMPPTFGFPHGTNFWVPFVPSRERPTLTADFARLAPGVSLSTVRAELPGVIVTPLSDHVRPTDARSLGFLLAATTMLLLIAWTHGAALLTSRAINRLRELGVRVALGATPSDIRRHFGAEGFCLLVGAAAVGTAAAISLTPIVASWLPVEISGGRAPGLNSRAFVFLLGLTGIGVLLWSILPLEILRRADPVRLVGHAQEGLSPGRSDWLRPALLVVQISLATALTYGAAMALESYSSVRSLDLGFQPQGLVAVPFPLPTFARTEPAEAIGAGLRHNQRAREAAAEILALPGVTATTFTTAWPLTPLPDPVSMAVGGDQDALVETRRLSISIGYPGVIGARVLEGREAMPEETRVDIRSRPVVQAALANESLAKLLRAYGPVLGTTLSPSPGFIFRIVGVVGDIKQGRIDQATDPTLYSYLQEGSASMALLVRASPSAIALIQRHLPTNITPGAIVDLEQLAWEVTATHRARAQVLGLVAFSCLALLVVGVSGAITEAVARRRRSIAIRLVMGATNWQAIRQSIRTILTAVNLGVLIGLGTGAASVRLASSAFHDVRPLDLSAAFLAASSVLVAAALAAFLPARRAACIEPASILKEG